MPTIRLPNNWQPRPYQRGLWEYLERGGKRALQVAHRRWGKDDVFLHWTAVAAMQRVGTYWYMLPQQNQSRRAIWEAVNPHTGKRRIDEAFPKEIRERTREDDMTIRFRNGSMFHVVGSDNYNALVGSPPVGIVCSEFALSDPSVWGFLRPILAENGGWAAFISTPRGRNHFYNLLQTAKRDPEWYGNVQSARDTGVFTTETLDRELEELIEYYGENNGRMMFEQEYLCDFDVAIMGAFYAAELKRARTEGRIRASIPIDRGLSVWTAWDLGISDSTAIWFGQTVGQEERIIDYYEASGVGLDHYATVLKDRRQQYGWTYGEHYLPHDVAHRSLSTGMSRVETLAGLGIEVVVVPRHNVMDGINATRRYLDRCWIDETKCQRGLEALTQYRRDYDEKLRIFKTAPLHDWTSHGADALRIRSAMAGGAPTELQRKRYDSAPPKAKSWMAA